MNLENATTAKKDLMLFAFPTGLASGAAFIAWSSGNWNPPSLSATYFLLLYLTVDFPHVYSTLHRFRQTKTDSTSTPAILGITALFSFAILCFAFQNRTAGWTALAYLAIFHFVRQQVGWLKLIQRNEPTLIRRLETALLYTLMLSGIAYWHVHMAGTFVWFPQALNVYFPSWISPLLDVALVILAIAILISLGQRIWRDKILPLAKILLFTSTFITWQVFIRWVPLTPVSFAIFNTITHGLPYLFWMHWYARFETRTTAGIWAASVFFLPLVALAYGENLIFHQLIGSSYQSLFGLKQITLSPAVETVALALVLTPQTTHFFIDGLIWRFRKSARLQEFLVYLRADA